MSTSTQLVQPSLRTVAWPVLAVCAPLSAMIVRLGVRDGLDPTLVAVPVATTLLGGWLCLLFEDRAAELTRPTPTPLWVRRAVRVTVALPPVALAWFACTWIGPLTGPAAPMAFMAIATAVSALACGATASRHGAPERSGVPAAAALVGIVLLLPISLSLVLDRAVSIDPAQPPIGTPLSYWATITALSAIVLVAAHRDPARRVIGRRRSRSTVRPRSIVASARDTA